MSDNESDHGPEVAAGGIQEGVPLAFGEVPKKHKKKAPRKKNRKKNRTGWEGDKEESALHEADLNRYDR